ncbi:MAG: hypothetical protein IPH35_27015 [Rhodoferax sp.]|nr:hypothetical protein [Rhodoferax sp.]
MTRRALLVEGYTDTLFVKGVLSVIGILGVSITPPKEMGASGNGVSNVIRLLPAMIAKIQSGDFDCFGILVDADYAGINGGFQQRRQEIENILFPAGYIRMPADPLCPFGSQYDHPTQITIHLGIFPDHANDGMVEDLLAQSVTAGQQSSLHSYAQACLVGLPVVLYNQTLHTKKAEIQTLLSWQAPPGIDSGIATKNGVFDTTMSHFDNFSKWLQKVFP